MFANCQLGGTNMAMPDVCKTPVGPSIVPIPYPNISMGATANPSTVANNILISGAPGHTVGTAVPMSGGGQPGVAGGVVSGAVMGSTKVLMGSTSIFFGGKPAARLTSMTGQNGSSMNALGATVSPSQIKILILK